MSWMSLDADNWKNLYLMDLAPGLEGYLVPFWII